MQIHYTKLFRHVAHLPRHWRMLVGGIVCLIIFWQGDRVGEPLGKALYFLTH
jgi:hypothetical protein